MNQTHPLVDAYLERLDALLHGASASTRSEVLAGVREHLHDSLATSADEKKVRQVLTELGTPEQIADEAYAIEPPTTPTTDTTSDARPRDRRWLPSLVMVIGLVIVLFLALFTATAPHVSELFFVLLYPPLWPAFVVLVLVARGWSGSEKAVLIGVLPASCALVAVVASVTWGIGPQVGSAASITALTVAVIVSAGVLIVLGRRGIQRAR
jgi:hypothetical protein